MSWRLAVVILRLEIIMSTCLLIFSNVLLKVRAKCEVQRDHPSLMLARIFKWEQLLKLKSSVKSASVIPVYKTPPSLCQRAGTVRAAGAEVLPLPFPGPSIPPVPRVQGLKVLMTRRSLLCAVSAVCQLEYQKLNLTRWQQQSFPCVGLK